MSPSSSTGYPMTVHCSICLGTGLIDPATGDPHVLGTDGNGYPCKTCDGYGQFTDCPLCRGDGCWDCDGGMVAGP